MGGDFLIDRIEHIHGTNWLEFYGIAAPIIPMISTEQQFAEKLHAYTLPRQGINTRSKDLIDLILLLKSKNQSPEAVLYVLQRVFKARNTHPLPVVMPKPPKSWEQPFAAMATECGMSENLNDGFTQVSKFYDMLQAMS